jgi:hypothetical protein
MQPEEYAPYIERQVAFFLPIEKMDQSEFQWRLPRMLEVAASVRRPADRPRDLPAEELERASVAATRGVDAWKNWRESQFGAEGWRTSIVAEGLESLYAELDGLWVGGASEKGASDRSNRAPST